MLSVAVFALLGCVAALVIKKLDGSIGALVGVACAVGIGTFAVASLSPFTTYVNELSATSEFGTYFNIMIKGLSVAFLCECASDICRDCQESSVASKVELAGKAELLILALPLIRSVIELSRELFTQ